MSELTFTNETGRFCPACGYDQSGSRINALMNEVSLRCPECGRDWRLDELLIAPPPGPFVAFAIAVIQVVARVAKVGGVIGAALFITLSMFSALSSTHCGRSYRSLSQLHGIQNSMMVY